MQLDAAAQSLFVDEVRVRGESCRRRGAVSLVAGDSDAWAVEVQGTTEQPHRLLLDCGRLDSGELQAWCSCPRFSAGTPCKHLWAAICEVAGALPQGGQAPARLRLQRLDVAAARARHDQLRQPRRSAARAVATAKAVGGARSGSWRRQLSEWRGTLQHHGCRGHVAGEALAAAEPERHDETWWFVLDLSRSIQDRYPSLHAFVRRRRRDGQLSKPLRRVPDLHALARCGDPQQRQLLALLLGGLAAARAPANPGGEAPPLLVTPELATELGPRLNASGRLGWCLSAERTFDDFHPLGWDGAEPWRCALRAAPCDPQGQEVADGAPAWGWRLTGRLVRTGETADMADVVAAFPAGLVVFRDRLGLLRPADFAWVRNFQQGSDLAVKAAEWPALLKALAELPDLPQIDMPASAVPLASSGTPRGRLTLAFPDEPGGEVLEGTISLLYGRQEVDLAASSAGVWDGVAERIWLRDPEAERALLQRLAAAPVRLREDQEYVSGAVHVTPQNVTEVVEQLEAGGWEVLAEGRAVCKAGDARISVRSEAGDYVVEAGLAFGAQQLDLPCLLDASRRGSSYALLDDGTLGVLPAAWLRRCRALAAAAEGELAETLRFSRAEVLVLDALLPDQHSDAIRLDPEYARRRAHFRACRDVAPRGEPRGFCGTLRPYQRDALAWFKFLRDAGLGGCLSDGLGMGKKVQVLALLQERRNRRMPAGAPRRPSLVVTQRGRIANWLDEASRYAPRLSWLDLSSSGGRLPLAVQERHDVAITTYEALKRDVEQLREQRFDYLVFDEARALKSPRSQAATACRELQADHRLALTSRPGDDPWGELWPLLESQNPGALRRAAAVRQKLLKGAADPASSPLLRRALDPLVLCRTSAQVADQLPLRTEQTLWCEMSPRQRDLYRGLREKCLAEVERRLEETGVDEARLHVLEALLQLRQAACDPRLLDPESPSEGAKIALLLDHLELLQGGPKTVVSSQFPGLLALLRAELASRKRTCEYIDGKLRDRAARAARFRNDPDCGLLLIAPKAAAGLDLTAAEYAFLLDPGGGGLDAGLSGFADRGAPRGVPLTVYRLIARDTAEQRIAELRSTRASLADALVAANPSLLRGLTRDDVRFLLG